MIMLQNQNRIILGLLLLIILLLAGAATAWYRMISERSEPPAGARLVMQQGTGGAYSPPRVGCYERARRACPGVVRALYPSPRLG